MKAYVFERINTQNRFYNVISDEVREIVEGLFKRIIADVKQSPLSRKYKIIRFANLAIEGNASLTTKDGEHEFPFWHGAAYTFPTPPNAKKFFEALERLKERLIEKILDFESGEMEYQGDNSSKAEEISIESMRLYCEYPKSKKELSLLAARKRKRTKKIKNSDRGYRNKKSRQAKRKN